MDLLGRFPLLIVIVDIVAMEDYLECILQLSELLFVINATI